MFGIMLVLQKIAPLDTLVSNDRPRWHYDRQTHMLHADKNCKLRDPAAMSANLVGDFTVQYAFATYHICEECIREIVLRSADYDETFQNALALSCIHERIQWVTKPEWSQAYETMPLLAACRRNHMAERFAAGIEKDLAAIEIDKLLEPWADEMRNEIAALKPVTIDQEALSAEILRIATIEYIDIGLRRTTDWDGNLLPLMDEWCALVKQGYAPDKATKTMLATSPTSAKIGIEIARYELTRLTRHFKMLVAKTGTAIIGIVEKSDTATPGKQGVADSMCAKEALKVLFAALPRTFAQGKQLAICHPMVWKYIQAADNLQKVMEPHSAWETIHISDSPPAGTLEGVLSLWEPLDTASLYHRLIDAYETVKIL